MYAYSTGVGLPADGLRTILPDLLNCEIPTSDLATLVQFATFRAGRTIITSRDEAPFCGIIADGIVKSEIQTPQGQMYTTGLLFEQDFVHIRGGGYGVRIFSAATETSLLCFHGSLETLLNKYPKLGAVFYRLAQHDMDNQREWIGLLGRRTVEAKLAAFLGLLARRQIARSGGNDSEELSVEIPLKRSEIADFLGVTIESISRGITALRNDRIIRLHDTRLFEVLDFERLTELSGG